MNAPPYDNSDQQPPRPGQPAPGRPERASQPPQPDIYGNVYGPSQPTDQPGEQPFYQQQPGAVDYGTGYGAQSMYGSPPSPADPQTPLPPTGSYTPTPESARYERGAYMPQYGQQVYGVPYAAMQYAGVGIRFIALLIDSIVIGVLAAIVESLFPNTSTASVLAAIIMFAYFIIMEAIWGATLGKMALKLRVVRTDGTPISWQESAVRNLLRIIDGLFFYLVGAIFAWLSPMRQRLGDRAARTVVIRE